MDKNTVKREADALFRQWDCPGWRVEFWDSTRNLGQCDHRNKIVWMNEGYCLHNPDDMVLDTLKHEVAHIKAGPDAGHGIIWKKWCERIGCTPAACSKNPVLPPKPVNAGRRRLSRR